MAFIAREYGRTYAPNTRETFRRQVLHQFVQARVADYNPYEPELPTNSPRAHYALTEAALAAIRSYGTSGWDQEAVRFVAQQGSLLTRYRQRRARQEVPLQLPNGAQVRLSPGKHNRIQAAVVERFVPQFVPDSRLLYLGDTARKIIHMDVERLSSLGIPITEHDKLPDIVILDEKRNLLFLVEVVTAHGPMTPKRVVELEEMLRECKLGKIFLTAFPDLTEFRKNLQKIAWETEVWIADTPDHLVHFNGDRFLTTR